MKRKWPALFPSKRLKLAFSTDSEGLNLPAAGESTIQVPLKATSCRRSVTSLRRTLNRNKPWICKQGSSTYKTPRCQTGLQRKTSLTRGSTKSPSHLIQHTGVVAKTHKNLLQVSLLIVAKVCIFKTLLKVLKVYANPSQLQVDAKEIALER